MLNLRKAFFMFLELMMRMVINPRLRARLLAMLGAQVGKNARIYEVRLFNLENGFRNLRVGDDVHIGQGCYLDLQGSIAIGRGATIAPCVKIITHDDPGSSHQSLICKVYPPSAKAVAIGEYCWIGCNVTVLPGANIGNRVVVGAGGLVRGQLSSDRLYCGVPVREVKKLNLSQIEPEP